MQFNVIQFFKYINILNMERVKVLKLFFEKICLGFVVTILKVNCFEEEFTCMY